MTVLELCFSSGVPAQLPPTPLPSHPEFLISGREEGTLSCWALSCLVLPQGRNASEQVKMLQRIEQYNAKQPLPQRVRVSVEIEKPREELFQLFGYGEVVFVSKDVAKHLGFQSAAEALRGLYGRVKKGATLICAWAEKGADALGPDGQLLHSDAFPPPRVVDTLGAGDTFNASVIFSLSKGNSVQEALRFGCQVAGRKCGLQGFEGIV